MSIVLQNKFEDKKVHERVISYVHIFLLIF